MTSLVRPALVFAAAGVGLAVLAATGVARAADPVPPAPAASATPEPTPAPAPPAPPARAPVPAPPTTAVVHIATNFPGTILEIRDFDRGDWRRACDAPCDRPILVDGADVRVRAPGMTDSNTFRIDPGGGTARLRVSGGSASTRALGLTALVGGIPLSLGGLALYGYGRAQDESGLQTAGIVTLAVGGVLVLGSLPLLGSGRTSIRDGRGKLIARRHELPQF